MPEIRIFEDAHAMCVAAANLFLAACQATTDDQRNFRVALGGGSTPRVLNRLLASDAYRDKMDWDRVFFYWGDERTVAPDHEDSNYRMAAETLLNAVPVPPQNIYRMPAERADLDVAASEYQEALAAQFGANALPRFDLILLGMGSDGHTASLFPSTRALSERERWVVGNDVPQLGTRRMTLTYPVLNAAAVVVFTVAGKEKASALKRVLEGPIDTQLVPAQGVAPSHGEVFFLVDEAAAALLSPGNPTSREA